MQYFARTDCARERLCGIVNIRKRGNSRDPAFEKRSKECNLPTQITGLISFGGLAAWKRVKAEFRPERSAAFDLEGENCVPDGLARMNNPTFGITFKILDNSWKRDLTTIFKINVENIDNPISSAGSWSCPPNPIRGDGLYCPLRSAAPDRRFCIEIPGRPTPFVGVAKRYSAPGQTHSVAVYPEKPNLLSLSYEAARIEQFRCQGCQRRGSTTRTTIRGPFLWKRVQSTRSRMRDP